MKYEIGKQIKDEIGDDVVPIISIEEEVTDKFLNKTNVDEIDLDFTLDTQVKQILMVGITSNRLPLMEQSSLKILLKEQHLLEEKSNLLNVRMELTIV